MYFNFQRDVIESKLVLKVTVTALYEFEGQDSTEINFQEGDIIEVAEVDPSMWWTGTNTRTGAYGMFPSNYIEEDSSMNLMVHLNKMKTELKKLYENHQLPSYSIFEGNQFIDSPLLKTYDMLEFFFKWPECKIQKDTKSSVELQPAPEGQGYQLWSLILEYLTPVEIIRIEIVNKETRNFYNSKDSDSFWKYWCRGMSLGHKHKYRDVYKFGYLWMIENDKNTQPKAIQFTNPTSSNNFPNSNINSNTDNISCNNTSAKETKTKKGLFGFFGKKKNDK